MLKNGKIYSPTFHKNNSFKKPPVNIFCINNREKTNYFREKENKNSIISNMKNKVIISNTFNSAKYKSNLKNFFFDNKNINNSNEINIKDIYYIKNNDFLKYNPNLKSQRIFKFYIPKMAKKEDGKDSKFYRYSSSNIFKDNKNYKNNNNNIMIINKSTSMMNRNKMINISKANAINKNTQKFLKFHEMNLINNNNNSKEKSKDKSCKINHKIITNKMKIIKDENNKIKQSKKRPQSTRYKINFPKNINSLDDLLDINEKNCVNSLSNQLEKYEIGKTLGRGAYAIVKIVTNKSTNEKYAAKIYNKSDIKDEIKKRCVNNEIEILKKISNKNIIKLIEVIDLKEHILIIQELFYGISLSQYYKKNWKSEDLTKEKEKTYKIILTQIFEAVNYLHKNNIAHLDIKLENILINKKLEIKLIDFGFGKYDPKNKLNNFFGGTPNYMSPEIVLKRPYISTLSDIWSLGVLVFKLFNNDYPFKGFTEKDLYNSIKKGKYSIKFYVKYDIKKIINSMLVLEPHKRLSCEQLLKNPWFNNNENNK